MWNEKIPTTMKKVPFQNTNVVLREYDFETDPEKLAVHLFNMMSSLEENIQSIREGDKWLDDPHHFRKRLVADIEGELSATTTIEQGFNPWIEHRYTLYSVVTAQQYQGSGLSQILFEYVKEWIAERGGTLILVDTWENNIPARKFYEKMGFNQFGSLPNGLKSRDKSGYVAEILYFLEIDKNSNQNGF